MCRRLVCCKLIVDKLQLSQYERYSTPLSGYEFCSNLLLLVFLNFEIYTPLVSFLSACRKGSSYLCMYVCTYIGAIWNRVFLWQKNRREKNYSYINTYFFCIQNNSDTFSLRYLLLSCQYIFFSLYLHIILFSLLFMFVIFAFFFEDVNVLRSRNQNSFNVSFPTES